MVFSGLGTCLGWDINLLPSVGQKEKRRIKQRRLSSGSGVNVSYKIRIRPIPLLLILYFYQESPYGVNCTTSIQKF